MTRVLKHIKFSIYALTLFIISLFVRLPFLNRVPNSVAPEQVQILERLHLYVPLHSPIILIIQLIVSVLFLELLRRLILKLTGDELISLIIGLSVSLSPWFFILSIHFNIYIYLLLVLIIILSLPMKLWVRLVFAGVVTTCLPILFGNIPFAHSFTSNDTIAEIMKITDLRTLFFVGDWSSTFVRVPKTGYFLYVDVLFLAIGSYSFLNEKGQKLIRFLTLTAPIGALFFLAHIFNFIPSYRSVFILLTYGIVVGYGYALGLLNKNIFIRLVVALAIIINTFFYLELVYFHFDKQNSSDWSYVQSTMIDFVNQNNIKTVYLTSGSNTLSRFLNYYLRERTTVELRPVEQLKNKCNDLTLCIVTAEDLKYLGIEKEGTVKQFTVYSGLPVYFAVRY